MFKNKKKKKRGVFCSFEQRSSLWERTSPVSRPEEAELLAVWGSGSHPVAFPVFVN